MSKGGSRAEKFSPGREWTYSVELKEWDAIPGSRRPLRSIDLPNDAPMDCVPGAETLYEIFLHGLSFGKDRPLLGYRIERKYRKPSPYKWVSYSEAFEDAKCLSRGLLELGIEPKSYVASVGSGGKEWFLLYNAAAFTGISSIMLQDSCGESLVVSNIKRSRTKAVIASERCLGIISRNLQAFDFIETIIIMTTSSLESSQKTPPYQKISETKIKLVHIDELRELGRKSTRELCLPTGDSVAAVVFTSGTTGEPTAIELTHRNFSCSVLNCTREGLRCYGPRINSTDVLYSYLPMSHVIELSAQVTAVYAGAAMGFRSQDDGDFLANAADLRPTIFVSAPRFYNIMYHKLCAETSSGKGLYSKLFKMAYDLAVKEGAKKSLKLKILEKIVFSKIRAVLGGRIRIFISGSASVVKEVRDFFSICFSCAFLQSYGCTETCGAVFFSFGTPDTEDTVGPPSVTLLVRLADVPILGYVSTDQYASGEICIKGPCLAKGCYDAENGPRGLDLDEDGWFHTGDIGCWTDQGSVKIIDRKVNIVPLKCGTLLVSERVENIYQLSNFIDVYVSYAHREAEYAVGIAILRESSILIANESIGTHFTSLAEAVNNKDFRTFVKKGLDKFVIKYNLDPMKVARKIYFEPRSIKELDILTPSYKIKRHIAYGLYKDVIEKLYEEEDGNESCHGGVSEKGTQASDNLRPSIDPQSEMALSTNEVAATAALA